MTALGKLTLRNYRCFNWENPAVLEFGEGFTAFIGTNNSGKSTVLRSVYELRNMFPQILTPLAQNTGFRVHTQPNGTSDTAELANDNDPARFRFSIEIAESARPKTKAHLLAIELLLEYEVQSQMLTAKQVRAVDFQGHIRQFDEGGIKATRGNLDTYLFSYPDGLIIDYSELYAFSMELHQSKYFPAFRNAINTGAGAYYDLPVGTALVSTWDQWKAGNSRAQKTAINRVEKEIASLLGFDSLQINADQPGNTLDIIVDDRPQKLYEVGAGVAQLIIVLAAALVSKPPYILIDEPELNLHPALQLNLLATLGSYAQKGLLYSTHSIGLARSTAQRIFAVKRIKNGSSKMSPFSDQVNNYGEWLGELSYSSRVDLGCEGLLLVEGPTEVLCFQEFLRKLGKDQKFVLIQLGGSSLIRGGVAVQLAELSRIVDPSKIHGFIDSERNSAEEEIAADRSAFVAECEQIGIHVQLSERKATENYFEIKGIRKALGNSYQPLESYQKLKDGPTPWRKSDNWKIARETNFEDIKDTDLGKFLVSL